MILVLNDQMMHKKVCINLRRSLIIVKVSKNNFDFRCLKLILLLEKWKLKRIMAFHYKKLKYLAKQISYFFNFFIFS